MCVFVTLKFGIWKYGWLAFNLIQTAEKINKMPENGHDREVGRSYAHSAG